MNRVQVEINEQSTGGDRWVEYRWRRSMNRVQVEVHGGRFKCINSGCLDMRTISQESCWKRSKYSPSAQLKVQNSTKLLQQERLEETTSWIVWLAWLPQTLIHHWKKITTHLCVFLVGVYGTVYHSGVQQYVHDLPVTENRTKFLAYRSTVIVTHDIRLRSVQ